MRMLALVVFGITALGVAAAAQIGFPGQRGTRPTARVAIVSCDADINGVFQFSSGDVNGRALEFDRAMRCSEVLALLARDGFIVAPATTTQSQSGFTPDEARTMTAIALAESGGRN